MQLVVDDTRLGGWIFVCTDNKQTMSFGPFADYEELKMWLETIGDENKISGMAIPLVDPASNPERFSAPLYELIGEDSDK